MRTKVLSVVSVMICNVLYFFLTFSQFSQYKKAHNKTSCSWAPQCSQLLWAFQPFRRFEEQNGFLSRKREGYFFMKIGRYRLYFHASAIFSWHCLCIRDNSNKIKLCALMQKGLNSTTYCSRYFTALDSSDFSTRSISGVENVTCTSFHASYTGCVQ